MLDPALVYSRKDFLSYETFKMTYTKGKVQKFGSTSVTVKQKDYDFQQDYAQVSEDFIVRCCCLFASRLSYFALVSHSRLFVAR